MIPGLSIGKGKIEFLPPNVTSLIQPLDQGVIALMKQDNRRRFLTGLVTAADFHYECKNINVLDAI